jgi:hypothetical protein
MKTSLLTALLLGGIVLTETAAAQTAGFVQWPLTANANDNAAVRSANVTPGTPVFRKLVLSNGLLPTGTNNQAFAAYSSAGQAFAPVADGGGWSTTVSSTYPNPGTGGSPRRVFYEQFSLTATGAPVRIDSAVFNINIFNSAAGKVAVAWSRSNFTTDSSSVSGGKGPAINNGTNVRTGGVLDPTENGTFGVGTSGSPGNIANNAAVLPQTSTNAPTVPDRFSFALNGATGVTLTAGQTLTVRIYPAVGSSSGGRYVLLRNVILKSLQVALAARQAVQTNLAVYPNPAQNQLNVPHTASSRDARVTVFSTTGAKVATFAAQPGTTETAVDLSSLSKGLYLVEYADGLQRSSARIVKE